MSNISTAYDLLISELTATFTTKKRIPNPYDLSRNSILLLENGYGIRVEGQTKRNLDICRISTDRTMTIIFTRRLPKLESDPVGFDEVTKLLLEDVVTAQALIYNKNSDFNDQATSGVTLLDLSDSTGPQFFLDNELGQDYSFASIEFTFIMTIEEQY